VRFQKTADLPAEFYADWLKIAADEAKVTHLIPLSSLLSYLTDMRAPLVQHYGMLKRRLGELGSHYGALPAHVRALSVPVHASVVARRLLARIRVRCPRK
jgi:uncharacterized ferritin-like protein (DUF455 family)